ncbi:MAG: InlB B-repeat-containing protein, partial [Clostridia bacterium]|nr:InlB B-repeat-containing protein [Clostridia bacterium]
VTVILDNDINLDGVSNWQPIGDNSIAAEASFAGTFEGGGHRITGLTINTDKAYQGLFGKVTGTVKDLTVTGSVTAGGYAGGIAGEVNGTIENCCFIGSVSAGSVAGGIVGLMGGGTVRDCTFSGSVTAANGYAGGLAGQLTGGTVECCTAIAEVTGGKECVGGLAGYLMGGILTNCVHVGNVTGTVNVEGNNPVLTVGVGGIAGRCGDFAVSIINNCHYTGAVSGYSYVGGVIGENRSTGVSQMLVGNYYLSGTVSCYGLTQGDRGIGYDRNGSPYGSENPSGVAPLSLEGFFDAVSFSGWDFDTVWIMTSERPAIQENGVDIAFGANGGTGSMDSIFLPPFGGMVPECGFTKEGCAFVCWNTSSDAGGTVYYPGDWMPGDRPQTLYAMWQSTESFGYVDSSGAARTARNCSAVSADLAVMRDGWYFASGEVTMTKRLEIYGDVRLILADGAVLNVPLGIHVPEGSSFTVYGQSEKYYDSGSVSLTQGTGVLNAGNLAVFGGSTYGDGAPIGGDRGETSGEIFLCGGIIRAESHSGAAAIGGGFDGSSGPIELSSGNFTAIGGTVDQENWECASSGIGAGVPLETGGRIVSSVSFAGLSIRSAVVHAEAGTLAGRGTPARAIGNSTGTDFDISK